MLEKELGLPVGLCARAEAAFLDPCAGRRGLWGLPAPAPPAREPAVCPSSPPSLGPWGPAVAVSPAQGPLCLPPQMQPMPEAVCTARVSSAPNRDSETKCVLWPFHVCLSCFNTKFITCSEINVRRYYLSEFITISPVF